MRGAGPTATILDGGGLDRVINSDSALTLQDLSVTNGKTTSDGGGVYAVASLTLSNTQFISNSARSFGGGVCGESTIQASACLFEGNRATNGSGGGVSGSGSLTLSNTQFISNTADYFCGGGVYGSSTIQASDCLFEGNRATVGGGVYGSSTIQASDCRFEGNRATNSGGGVFARGSLTLSNTQFISNSSGGGVCALSMSGGNRGNGGGVCALSSLALNNTQFISNSTDGDGGGVYGQSTIQASACLFESNRATNGGGASVLDSLTLSNSQFVSNTVDGDGGGVYGQSTIQASDCLFEGNTTDGDGGGVWTKLALAVNCLFAGNTAGGAGQALWVGSSSVLSTPARLLVSGSEILHCTFADATGLAGAAIYAQNAWLGVQNTLFANYDTGIELVTSTLSLNDYNLYDQVTDPISGGTLMGAHSQVGPAQFVAPAVGNYHLGAGSLAIDAALPLGVLQDLDGVPRDDPPDIGCYEYVEMGAPGLSATVGPALVCPGWDLYYQWTLTNTLAAALENASVSLVLPPNTCCPSLWQTLGPAWSYDEPTRTVTWQLGSVNSGEIVNGTVKVHTMSTLADGQVVTGTFTLLADGLTESVVAEAAAQGDTDACGGGVAPSTPTPTETATPTVTPTPTATPLPAGFFCLPVIIKTD